MSSIIVAGAGHGGIIAAKKLAEAGHRVAVFESSRREETGLVQSDAFDAAAMEYADIYIPSGYYAENNQITFVPLEADSPSLTLPKSESARTLVADRRELIAYLIKLAENAGVDFFFEYKITAPIILGSRVAGIRTEKGDFYADLIIDACGVNSPVRSALPDFTYIERTPSEFDVLHTYRAYFKRNFDAPQPDTYYNIYLKKDGDTGFSWLVNENETVDLLIARFPQTDKNGFLEEMRALFEEYPHMGSQLVRGGSFKDIPVRQPLAVLVADGYAAVGDSAFMTYPLKGSGIAYSLMAGTMLAKAIEKDEEHLFTAETLWEYEKMFFKDIGFDACRLAIAKNLLPYLTAQEVNDIFKNGLVSSEELRSLSANALDSILNSRIIPIVKDKIKLIGNDPVFKSKLLSLVMWFGRFAVTEPFFPTKYERKDVEKWAEKYNEFFDSIRYKHENENFSEQ